MEKENQLTSSQFKKRPDNVITMHARKHGTRIQDKFYKSKTSPRFPNLDASSAWQMGHNSQEGVFLGQELLLDFAAWIDLTSNADNSILSAVAYRTHFASLNRVDDLRVYQGFMMPLNHKAAAIQGASHLFFLRWHFV